MSSQSLKWRKLLTANSTDTVAFGATTLAQTVTAIGSSIKIGNISDLESTDWVMVQPYGKGAENSQFDLLIYGANYCSDDATIDRISLGIWTCTLSACIGVTGGLLAIDERKADTLTLSSAFSALEGVSVITVSPTNDLPACILLDRKGCPVIGAVVKRSDATEGNALIREL